MLRQAAFFHGEKDSVFLPVHARYKVGDGFDLVELSFGFAEYCTETVQLVFKRGQRVRGG